MSAQPIAFHGAHPARQLPNKIGAIRGALPAALRAQFQAELDAAVDSGDLAKIDAVKGKWWAQAMFPTVLEDFAAAERGEVEAVPSPLAAW